jgi:hypothetical protein
MSARESVGDGATLRVVSDLPSAIRAGIQWCACKRVMDDQGGESQANVKRVSAKRVSAKRVSAKRLQAPGR